MCSVCSSLSTIVVYFMVIRVYYIVCKGMLFNPYNEVFGVFFGIACGCLGRFVKVKG